MTAPTRSKVVDQLRAWALESAPRKAGPPLAVHTDLGFPEYGMTILEYLALVDRACDHWAVDPPAPGSWPHTLAEMAARVPGDRQ